MKSGLSWSVRAAFAAALALTALPAAATVGGSFLVAARAAPAPSGAQSLCSTYSWACDGRAGAQRSREMDLVKRVNRSVNASTREISDRSQYAREEHWALPTRRGGDCEDFALIKKRELIRSGVAPARLLIATALDRQRRSHAVLIYRSAGGDVVLDNQTDRLRGWQQTGYVFLRMQDPADPRRWVSGFTSR
ncbi:transglutaminase-like cysteine peptidase [Vannielia litorea]|uniref:transglutaminase-like cysteine peptidase n=1 Tax=Vannielia litorea TaxID=1217970 RepID=UPI001C98B77D|nr:transglutaminase-like cysteine peptidase [Vannielia litorea]MBY6047644.1 transglutaminase-like cysteine peptidase [Vannielia litorea]MBY6075058.1 transglutaminase-like cysteine peptidase [Vannielia litorea]